MSRPPLGTHMRRGPPGTSARLGTGARLGTAVRLGPDGQPLAPVGLTTTVNAPDRPVTQQGMMGVTAGTGGPGRQHRDRTYYLGELRVKVSEINAEVARLRDEAARRERDGQAHAALSRRQSALAGEVAALSGELADLNLMLEKVRTEATAETLTRDYERVRGENSRMLERVNRIFTEKKAKESGCARVEQQISSHYAEAEAQLQDLTEEQRSTYYELQALNKQYLSDMASQTEELKTINDSLKGLEDELLHDPIKVRAAELRDRKRSLERERDEIQASLRQRLSGPEEKDRLLAQVRDDNAEIDFISRQVDEAKQAIAGYKEELEQGTADLEQRGDKFDKYKALLEKDRDMQAFIDSVPEAMSKEKAESERYQTEITELLRQHTAALARRGTVPTAEAARGLRERLEEKEQQHGQSLATRNKLSEDLGARRAELEKMATLDRKIAEEQAQLEKRMAEMKAEMPSLTDTEGLRQRAEEDKRELGREKAQLRTRIETLKTEVYQLQLRQEAVKSELSSDETASGLEQLEARVRTYANAGHGLREYCAAKGKEANYEGFKAEVLGVCDTVNRLVIDSCEKGIL